MGTTDDEHRLYHLRRCCEDVLDDFGARSTLNGYRYAERMLLYALYAERPAEDRRFAAVCRVGGEHRDRHCDIGAEPDVGGYVQARCGTVPRTLPALRPPENGVLSNGQLFEGLLKELRRRLEPTV